MKIGFVTVHVAELEKTIAFWQNVMGFSVSRQFKAGPKVEIVFMDDGHGNLIEFISGTGHIFKGDGISIGFDVPDIEAAAEHLRKHNVAIVFGPTAMPSGVKLLHAKDINGLEIGFVENPK